jgi:phosphoglycerol transferase
LTADGNNRRALAFGSLVYIVAFCVPGGLCWWSYFAPLSFPLASAALGAGLIGAGRRFATGRLARFAWSLLSIAAFSANFALAVTYYTQGQGYTDSYFHHLRPDIYLAGFSEHFAVLGVAAAALVVAAISYALLINTAGGRARGRHPSAWFLAALLVWPPLTGLLAYVLDGYELTHPGSWLVTMSQARDGGEDTRWPMPPSVDRAAAVHLPGNRNLVMIYTESIERAHYDEAAFAALTPGLRQLRSQAVDFSDVRPGTATGWTIAGIVASQCGLPLIDNPILNAMTGLSAIPHRDATLRNAVCLGDILKANGYATLWVSGTDLRFGGKTEFLKVHGFDNQYGAEEIAARLAEQNLEAARSSWGYYDDTVFALALEQLKLLEAGGRPFALFVLTMDTHHPKPLPSPSCPKVDADPMRQAIACTDRNVSNFIAAVERSVASSRTIVSVASDHLAHRTSQHEFLPPLDQRRYAFFVRGTDLPPQRISAAGRVFDIGATLVEFLGGGRVVIGAGQSLLEGSGFLAAHAIGNDRPYFLSPAWSARFRSLWAAAAIR